MRGASQGDACCVNGGGGVSSPGLAMRHTQPLRGWARGGARTQGSAARNPGLYLRNPFGIVGGWRRASPCFRCHGLTDFEVGGVDVAGATRIAELSGLSAPRLRLFVSQRGTVLTTRVALRATLGFTYAIPLGLLGGGGRRRVFVPRVGGGVAGVSVFSLPWVGGFRSWRG